jgi:hypothetical protein
MGHSGKKFTTKDNSNNTPFLFYDSKQLGVTQRENVLHKSNAPFLFYYKTQFGGA